MSPAPDAPLECAPGSSRRTDQGSASDCAASLHCSPSTRAGRAQHRPAGQRRASDPYARHQGGLGAVPPGGAHQCTNIATVTIAYGLTLVGALVG
jgi:hypothetical protein